jgi:serine/threonine-protein kinase PknG
VPEPCAVCRRKGIGVATELCNRPDCGGTLTDGFCDTCGMAPSKLPAAVAPPLPAPVVAVSTRTAAGPSVAAISARVTSGTTGSTTTGGTRLTSGPTRRRGFGAGLVVVPDVNPIDPATIVLADPEIPEKDRFCASCGEPVGRSKADRPGRLQGFCPGCRHPFDFAPKLAVGELVGAQYEVAGCLAHGGFGWIYLARDRNVSNRWVVLKGVIDSGNEEARSAALAERQFLATMEHSEIVKIYNFVAHCGAEYIVMEYVGGKSLKTILKERRDANNGQANPLPLEQALAYVIGILPAMSYLHEHGFLFCDFKPDNVIHQGSDLKLIDLGGARRIDDPDGSVYGTVGFQAPEIAASGPSVTSDLYTVVRTLAVLALDFRGFTKEHKFGAPTVEDNPQLAEFDSFRRLLQRGTAEDPAARFQSVDELIDQLTGVLREVVSVRTGVAHPSSSDFFTADLLSTLTDVDIDAVSWRALPTPLVASSDAAANFVVNLTAPSRQIPAIISAALETGQVPDSIETRLRVVRAYLDANEPAVQSAAGDAQQALLRAKELAPDDWRIRWYEGLVALAQNRPADAAGFFDAVTSWLPGEIAPRLALGFALELTHRFADAERFYDRASAVDPTHAFGVFGLGRCRSALGNRVGAVQAYGRVAASSVLHDDAGICEARALLADGSAKPGVNDVIAAAATVDRLALDAHRRAELARDVLRSALKVIEGGSVAKGQQLFGGPFAERPLRLHLESVLRELASQEHDRMARVALVDEANRVRPRTFW